MNRLLVELYKEFIRQDFISDIVKMFKKIAKRQKLKEQFIESKSMMQQLQEMTTKQMKFSMQKKMMKMIEKMIKQ